ncbi:hypothetical protein Acor_14620 [Acrocarpospora corrugata]|uniref:Uncharacterized protein n=1 Tax=Acrocarpospora corrugata TaxID=35763 RepID=A0A5M3VT53_9ACTN|nr:hypothetical protein [Acrocarpospora corrugata]GER99398.1 hypothetical protein Acor_14620 [Acrocarpospora corrugata]
MSEESGPLAYQAITSPEYAKRTADQFTVETYGADLVVHGPAPAAPPTSRSRSPPRSSKAPGPRRPPIAASR